MLNQGFWQQVAEYDREILGVFRDSTAARPVIDFLARHGPGKIVADLGCGPGQSFPYLAGAKCVFAVDSSAEMLAQARKNSPREAADRFRFIRADLADYTLPEPADISLLCGSFFPDGLHHAIRILTNVQQQTKPGGKVLLLVGAMESLLYWFHLAYRHRFEQGDSEEDLQLDAREAYGHLLTYGYFYNAVEKGKSQVVKYWIKEELADLLAGVRFQDIAIEKHLLPWERYYPRQSHLHNHTPTWFWRATMMNP